MISKYYGDYIRNEREKRNLSQYELSEITKSIPPGISRNTILNIENGGKARPSTRRKLEAALESVKVSTFYDSSK
jgi:transcriptional regulator with XRE-family HTH domain